MTTGPWPTKGVTARLPDSSRNGSARGIVSFAMLRSHLPQRATALRIYTAAVLANYAAQVPYNLHLYGGAFSRTGALVLGATLVWFLVAAALYRAGRRAGYWLLLSYAAVQVLFYLNNEVLLAFAGYGLPYHLARTEDLLVWVVFIVGDLNFLAAVGMVVYLLMDRSAVPRADP